MDFCKKGKLLFVFKLFVICYLFADGCSLICSKQTSYPPIFMAGVPICYKMTDFCLTRRYCNTLNVNTINNREWRLKFNSADAQKKEKRCLACYANKSKSVEKQLESLDAYFQKVYFDDADETSSKKNKEFFEKGGKVEAKSAQGSLENYLGKVNKEEIYVNASSTKVKWEKLKNYVKLKGEDDSELLPNESSDLYLIGILVSINIAVFLFEIASPIQNSELELFSLPSIYGAKINHLIVLGEWWRLVTPMFLHSGIFHMGVGSWVLLSFGPRVCKAYGSFTFLLIYILGGISGNMTSFLHTPDPTVGGTGPVFAVIGAWLIFQFQNKNVIEKNDSENLFVKAIFATALSFILSIFGPIDDWTHFGAILTGILYGYVTCPILQMDDKYQKNGQQERIGFVKRYTDSCKSVLFFSLFVAVLSSLIFIVEPPVNYLASNSFL